jgi:hypothetical protein
MLGRRGAAQRQEIMGRLQKQIPTALLLVLGLPFFLFIIEYADNEFRDASDLTNFVFRFILSDSAYSQIVTYLQAPLILGLVIRWHSPAAQGIKTRATLVWPRKVETWIFVGGCVVVTTCAYVSRFLITDSTCETPGSCIRAYLAMNTDMSDRQDTVYSTFREYCSVLFAGSIGLLYVVFRPAVEVEETTS